MRIPSLTTNLSSKPMLPAMKMIFELSVEFMNASHKWFQSQETKRNIISNCTSKPRKLFWRNKHISKNTLFSLFFFHSFNGPGITLPLKADVLSLTQALTFV